MDRGVLKDISRKIIGEINPNYNDFKKGNSYNYKDILKQANKQIELKKDIQSKESKDYWKASFAAGGPRTFEQDGKLYAFIEEYLGHIRGYTYMDREYLVLPGDGHSSLEQVYVKQYVRNDIVGNANTASSWMKLGAEVVYPLAVAINTIVMTWSINKAIKKFSDKNDFSSGMNPEDQKTYAAFNEWAADGLSQMERYDLRVQQNGVNPNLVDNWVIQGTGNFEGANQPLGSRYNQMNQPNNPHYQPVKNNST